MHGLSNRLFGDGVVPFFNYGFPGHATGNLLQDMSHKNAGAAKCQFSMAGIRVSNNVPPQDFGLSSSTVMVISHILRRNAGLAL